MKYCCTRAHCFWSWLYPIIQFYKFKLIKHGCNLVVRPCNPLCFPTLSGNLRSLSVFRLRKLEKELKHVCFSIHTSSIQWFVSLSIHPFIHPPIQWFIHPSTQPMAYLATHPSSGSPFHPSIYPFPIVCGVSRYLTSDLCEQDRERCRCGCYFDLKDSF